MYERICSLLPSATEIVCALGLTDRLVAVTHECDYPPEVLAKPRATFSKIDHENLSLLEIDIAVRGQLEGAGTLYELDAALLDRLTPDLILTQQLCDVCAVSFDRVQRVAADLPNGPKVISLDPHHLQDVLDCIALVGSLTGTEAQAEAVLADCYRRIGRVSSVASKVTRPVRTVLLEWLDPPFRAGHWTPEIIQLAGGVDAVGRAGEDATVLDWQELIEFAPEVVVIAQCGFGLERSVAEARAMRWPVGWDTIPAAQQGQVYVVDGNAYFSRPGPRIVDSLEIMAEILHPGLFPGIAPEGSYVRLVE